MRRTFALGIAMVMTVGACRKDIPVAATKNAALRTELLRRYDADQAVRAQLSMLMRVQQVLPDSVMRNMLSVDSNNTAWLKQTIAESGWPARAAVDSDGVNAAFMLVQHADNDTAFQASIIPLVQRAYDNGDFPGGLVALLADRLSIARNLPQEYGTQADLNNNQVVFKPIRDSANVDTRRRKMGLPPLKQYLWTLDSAYFGRMHN